jgi:hypothetical protein
MGYGAVTSSSESEDKGVWYGVRCVFGASRTSSYEERITLWRADSFESAVELAERDANEYAQTCELEYLGLAQAYQIEGENLENGSEVFSLVRDSDLAPNVYISRFFDTGRERQGSIGAVKGW